MSGTLKAWKWFAVGIVALGLGGGSWAANAGTSHEHGAKPVKATLDKGKKWSTDEPLRQGMALIRTNMEGALHAIHEGKLTDADYAALAEKVTAHVANIVATCKLAPKADAQLHLVIVKILDGANAMQGKQAKVKREAGAVTVLAALKQYETYFDDPNW